MIIIFFCYKDIGSKEFFTTATLLMPCLLENVENSTRSITLLLIGIVTLYTMCMPRWDTSRTNLNVWIVVWPFWVFPFWDCCMTGWDCYQNIWLSIQTKWIGIVVSNHSKEKLDREKKNSECLESDEKIFVGYLILVLCTGYSLSDQLNILPIRPTYYDMFSLCNVFIKLIWTNQKFKTTPCTMEWTVNVLLSTKFYCRYFAIFWLDWHYNITTSFLQFTTYTIYYFLWL